VEMDGGDGKIKTESVMEEDKKQKIKDHHRGQPHPIMLEERGEQ